MADFRCKALLACGSMVAWAVAVLAQAPDKLSFLHVGTTPGILADKSKEEETRGRDSLVRFIKSETGFENEVTPLSSYRELAEQLDRGKLQIGVFAGFEFAWAKEQYPELRPLALAINEFPNQYVHIVTRRDDAAKDFAGLQGQTFALPWVKPGHVQFFVDQQLLSQGKEGKQFFSRITAPENQEDALDDVVDGAVQAAAVDRVSLSAYRRRKPGRFDQLKEVAKSPALPASVVAYREGNLDKQTLQRLQDGLFGARNKQEGQRLLTLFRLTGFEAPADSFDRQLTETRKAYPPPAKR
jgi:ABC-type phosphate/phosphonate transport system substrate-binding protein